MNYGNQNWGGGSNHRLEFKTSTFRPTEIWRRSVKSPIRAVANFYKVLTSQAVCSVQLGNADLPFGLQTSRT